MDPQAARRLRRTRLPCTTPRSCSTTSIRPRSPGWSTSPATSPGSASIDLTATGTTDRRRALAGADYVVVNISTGGFASMRPDLEIPARLRGDAVGRRHRGPRRHRPRAQRNIPVFLDIARDMEELCPDAWLLNLTNPMTTICRALTRESSVRTVGLCHEITITQFLLSLLLGASFLELTPTVAGVNHLPFITEARRRGRRRARSAARPARRRRTSLGESRWRWSLPKSSSSSRCPTARSGRRATCCTTGG